MFDRKVSDKKYWENHREERRAYKRQYYQENKEKCKRQKKQWRADNPEKEREYRNQYSKQYSKTLRGRFHLCKSNARRRGFMFTFTFDEFVEIMNKPCHYCGGEGYGLYTEDEFINQCIKIVKSL